MSHTRDGLNLGALARMLAKPPARETPQPMMLAAAGAGGGGTVSGGGDPSRIVVLVRNDTASDIAAGTVLGIDSVLVASDGSPSSDVLTLAGVAPTQTDHAHALVVTLEPIAAAIEGPPAVDAGIGLACLAGPVAIALYGETADGLVGLRADGTLGWDAAATGSAVPKFLLPVIAPGLVLLGHWIYRPQVTTMLCVDGVMTDHILVGEVVA